MRPLVIFSHGKESGPWGTKIKHLAQIAEKHSAHNLSPNYSSIPNPDDRVKHLLSLQLRPHNKLILVGSSMGGYVSAVASETLKPDALFLMAPAFYIPGYANQKPITGAKQTLIVTGWQDEIIPAKNSIIFAQLHQAELHMLNADHQLNRVLTQVGILFENFLKRILD
jgi:predicted alpha/beta-hydrolase family hydrolase